MTFPNRLSRLLFLFAVIGLCLTACADDECLDKCVLAFQVCEQQCSDLYKDFGRLWDECRSLNCYPPYQDCCNLCMNL